MTSPKKAKLDLHQTSLDIISELINRQLEYIAGDILANLSDVDLSNAIVANPKWSAVATSRRRIKKLFSKNNEKTAHLKAMYKREEVLARQTQDSSEPHSLFLKSCIKYSNLNTSQSKLKNDGGENLFSLDSTSRITSASVSKLNMSSEFIALVCDSGVPKKTDRYDDSEHFIILFDRWSLKLVSALSITCNAPYLYFIKDNIDTVLISCLVGIRTAHFLWCVTTGEVHTAEPALPSLRYVSADVCLGNLIVMIENIKQEQFATVFKVDVGSETKFVCLVERESLGRFDFTWPLRYSNDLDYFALCQSSFPSEQHQSVYQVRSKADFSLLRVVTSPECLVVSIRDSFLFSDSLLFVCKGTSSVEAVTPVNGSNLRSVYRFRVPDEMPHSTRRFWKIVVIENRFLVLLCNDRDEFHAAIWKLPSDFAAICQRRFEEGTVGETSHCDQQIVDECTADESLIVRYGIDGYGITKSCTDKRTLAVVHMTMLSSIITDAED